MSAIASQITGVSIVVQTQIKENIRAPRHWPLSREFTGDREFLAQRTSNAENVSIWWRHNEIFMPARNLHAASPCATHGWSKITDSTRNASTCWSIYYTTSTSWWQENRPIADTQLPMVCTNAATVAKHYLHRNLSKWQIRLQPVTQMSNVVRTTFPFQFECPFWKLRCIGDVHTTRQPMVWSLQYIPRNMHTVFALLCFAVVIYWLIFPYPSGLLHWHCGNLTIAPVPAKQPWWIWINTSCEFIMNDYITTTKQSTTKPCAYFLGYTVCYLWVKK